MIKKHKLIIIGFLLFLFSNTACEKNINTNTKLKNKFEDAALLHNKAMNKVLFELQKNMNDSLCKANVLVKKTTENFINNNPNFFLKQLSGSHHYNHLL